MGKVNMTLVNNIKGKLDSHLAVINRIPAIRDRVESALASSIESDRAKDILDKKITIEEMSDREIISLFRAIFNQIKDQAFNPDNFTEESEEDKKGKKKGKKLYHPKFKEQFIEEHRTEKGKPYAESTKRVVRILFGKTGSIEDFYKKDIYDFDNNQFEEVLMALKSTTLRSLQNSISTLEQYIDFAIANKKTNKVNIATQYARKERISQFLVNSTSEKSDETNILFSKKTIDEISSYADNTQDGVILNLLFDGISHKNKFIELINLRIQDVDSDNMVINVPQLTDEETGEIFPSRQVPISSETLRLVNRAMDFTEKYVSVGKGDGAVTARSYKIAESEYILRGLRKNYQIKWENIPQRIIRLATASDYKYLNATNISYSGQVHYIHEMVKNGKDVDDAIREVMERFNLNDNESNFFYVKARYEKAKKEGVVGGI